MVHVYLCESVNVCGVLAHSSEAVKDLDGILHAEQLLLIVFEDCNSKAEEDLAAFVEESVPDTQHRLLSRSSIDHSKTRDLVLRWHSISSPMHYLVQNLLL